MSESEFESGAIPVSGVRQVNERDARGSYSPAEYWAELARSYGESDSAAFAPVLHPCAPRWFNVAIDRLQTRAWRRALGCCETHGTPAVLDVGCGTGRWTRRFSERGLAPVGIDRTADMIRIARWKNAASPLFVAEVQNLPFDKESFDIVSAVTVIQHIAYSQQNRALKEIVRVLRPNGHLLLIELIKGTGPHIMPHAPQGWIDMVCPLGCRLVQWFGQEFILLDRLFAYLVQNVRSIVPTSTRNHVAKTGELGKGKNGSRPGLRNLYWTLRRMSLSFSILLEPITERVSPQALATHGVFVFEKLPVRKVQEGAGSAQSGVLRS